MSSRKRFRSTAFTSNDLSQSSIVNQRTGGWGPYASYTPVDDSTVTRLPPTESSFMTELGGWGADDNVIQGGQSRKTFHNSSGLNGCQRLISDGLFDCNGYYTFTEENNFVQLVLYDFYKPDEMGTEIQLQPRTCFIDLGGPLKLALSNRGDGDAEQMKRLIQELVYTINASFGTCWPRFCWWNNEVLCPGSDWKKSCDNQYYYPQANPVDDNMDGNLAAAMFIQDPANVPLILCQIIGVSQLCFSINPAFQALYTQHDFYLQLMTPRMSPIFTNGNYPAKPYLNPNLINGCNGWFCKGPYVFGFGFRDSETRGADGMFIEDDGCGGGSQLLGGDGFTDIYGPSFISTAELDLMGGDFTETTTITFTSDTQYLAVNSACAMRCLQKVVLANMPCTLTNSRYYVVRSPELSSGQILPFLCNIESGGSVTEDTMGLLWNTVLSGNRPRDISGDYGINTYSTTAKEVNPMFNLTDYRLFIETEWMSLASSLCMNSNNMLTVQGEDMVSMRVKNSTLYYSNQIPSIYDLKDTEGNAINTTRNSFPSLYDSLAPSWKTEATGSTNYDSQMDVQRVCRNRLLIRYNTTADDPPLPTSVPDVNTPNYFPIEDLWNSSLVTAGLQKTADKSVHFIRAIGF